jgi:uncharacterized protein (TIGR02271 family)
MTTDQRARGQGQTAYDSTGQRIGDIGRVFLDRETNEPAWITVRGGPSGQREAVVPLAGSRLGPDGLSVAVRKDAISSAPPFDAGGELDNEAVDQLTRHYDRSMSVQQAAEPDVDPRPVELTTFEEQVRVDTEAMETGTVRIRKVVATEPVQTTVPLRHEEVRVERVSVTEGRPAPEHDFAEESVEVTLHEERPVIAKETVPVETVRLAPQTREDQQRVTDQVRRERIEIDDQRSGSRRPQ